jgi:hypothetical protein
MKLLGVFMIFYCTKLNLSKCNGSQVVSIKQNMKFGGVCIFASLGFHKNDLIRSCSSTENLSAYKIVWSRGASFVSVSEA